MVGKLEIALKKLHRNIRTIALDSGNEADSASVQTMFPQTKACFFLYRNINKVPFNFF